MRPLVEQGSIDLGALIMIPCVADEGLKLIAGNPRKHLLRLFKPDMLEDVPDFACFRILQADQKALDHMRQAFPGPSWQK